MVASNQNEAISVQLDPIKTKGLGIKHQRRIKLVQDLNVLTEPVPTGSSSQSNERVIPVWFSLVAFDEGDVRERFPQGKQATLTFHERQMLSSVPIEIAVRNIGYDDFVELPQVYACKDSIGGSDSRDQRWKKHYGILRKFSPSFLSDFFGNSASIRYGLPINAVKLAYPLKKSNRRCKKSPSFGYEKRAGSYIIYVFGYDQSIDNYKVVSIFCYDSDGRGHYKTEVMVYTLVVHIEELKMECQESRLIKENLGNQVEKESFFVLNKPDIYQSTHELEEAVSFIKENVRKLLIAENTDISTTPTISQM
ncbi:hypothetical protein K1719_029993 [Acacia pycnantha]|nr:hypothetical protein K1719_029993 [Acacia pycnantha]